MATATQQIERYGSHSIIMSDLRHKQAMQEANDNFVAALERYFLARDLWAK